MRTSHLRAMIGASALSLSAAALAPSILAVRAEGDAAAEIRILINNLTKDLETKLAANAKAWDDFKAENNAARDGLDEQKVGKINSAMDQLGKEIDKINSAIALLKAGGADLDQKPWNTPEQKAYAKGFNAFFRKGAENGLRDLEVKAAANAGSDPDGGYTVPYEMEMTIDRVLAKVSAMRQLATVKTISTGAYKKPFNVGGTNAGWVGEQSARPQTQASQLSLLEFPAMELYAEPAATQSLLDDSAIDIGAWLGDEVSLVFGEQEGGAFISGDGQKQPFGIMSASVVADASWKWGKLGYIQVASAGAFATDGTGGDGLIDLIQAIKTGYRTNASWLMNRATEGKVRKIKDGNGNYAWVPGLQAGQAATLLGYPVANDDNMPDMGNNVTAIAFGDFKRGYLIVDRIGVRVLRDPYTAKPYVLFYTTKRVGGGIQNYEAIKLGRC